MKSFILSTALLLIVTGGANAADAIVAEEPAPVLAAPVFTWTGGYVGAQIGYGWGRTTFRDDEDTLRLKPDGVLGGLYAGYNFDTGNNFVFGVDGDVTYNGLKDSDTDIEDEFDLEGGLESKLRWSGALRARAGVAFDRVLPYVAGGIAFGNVKNYAYITDGVDTLSASESKTHTGWTIGGGVDYAATDNLILRAEYRYTDYGRKSVTVGDEDFGGDFDYKLKTHDIRLGVAYKF